MGKLCRQKCSAVYTRLLNNMKEINYALVEDVRPPIYTAMKYWGKKPHNIWREYIANYTSENGLYLDPFAGSAISVFEAIKAKKKAIAFDLNPLTSFIIEVMSAPFDKNKFKIAVAQILSAMENDEVYKQYFFTQSRNR
jgi:tRNA G37 N-methylase Trm5